MTKERPIIFNGDMVRAILDGRKTQTRRAVKPQPLNIVPFIGADDKPTWEFGVCLSHHGVISRHARCPFGQSGDQLWVRETHHVNHHGGVIYRADWQGMNPFDGDECGDDCSMVGEKWKPSIHMPRWASRILLEITDVRVERVQDISEKDAIAEGADHETSMSLMDAEELQIMASVNILSPNSFHRIVFQYIWDQIYGPEAWDRNDWVWVIEFKRIEAN